jgi:DNA polymerase IV
MPRKYQPIIAHIDMNSYFASVAQQDRPEWRGKPLGVCEHLGGIIIAPSVEAKRWGIKTGMPVWEAKKLYPKIILTQTSPDRYRYYTARFLKVFGDYTDRIEKYSIDEAFLDLTKACNIREYKNGQWVKADPWQEAAKVAREIKARMVHEVGDWIRCSVGISYSKLVAKIASDLQKPDGLVIVRPEDKQSLYDRLELTDIPGIGNRMKRSLRKLGIRTLANLRDYPLSKLVTYYGISGYHLHSMGQLEGSWKESFEEDVVAEPLKSIGHMYTIPIEYRKRGVMKPVLYKLCEMVAARLRVNELMGDVAHVFTHNSEGMAAGRGGKIGYYTQDGREIYGEALALLEQAARQSNTSLKELDKDCYFVGITLAGLVPFAPQENLFHQQKNQQQRSLMAALDKINEKYEDFTIARVPAFLARDIIRDSVGFGRMKEFKTTWMGGGQGRFK